MDEGARNADAEIAAIFTRLKAEVRGRPPKLPAAVTSTALPSRAKAERAWSVSVEHPLEQRPTQSRVRRTLLSPVKRVLRKLMRWYVEPFAAEQRTFNLTMLTLVDELTERTAADVSRLERRLNELEQRLAHERLDE